MRRPRLLRTTLAVVAVSVVLLTPGSAGAATSHAAVRMPNLVGLSRAQVFRVMHNDGLYFETRGPGSATGHWVVALSQSPKPGVAIAWHGQAVVHVTTQLPRGPRPMPKVTGLSRAAVFAAMRRAQLYFKTVGSGSSTSTWTVALAQSPAPGTKVPWHGQVTVRVAISRPKAPVKTATPAKVSATVVNGTGFKIGVATWYDYVPGRCATWYLPKGTRITVRDLTTGKAIVCVITDRENEGGNHVVDLSETQFSQLEPLSKGVISVKVSW
ncbi:MAG TPA: PASTA domain-containing protein [Acidimicrobiales bacterium]